MSNEKDDPARQQRAYLEEWLQRDERQRALRPDVTRMLGTAVWQVDAMDALRGTSPEMAREVEYDLTRSFTALKESLPLPPSLHDSTTTSTTSYAAASSNRVYEALMSTRGTDPLPRVTKEVRRYESLVAEQGRAQEAGRRVGLLFPELAERFKAALDAAEVAKRDELVQESAAMEMRTFLYKLKGELFAKARMNAVENMTWELMAERLGVGAGCEGLVEQGGAHGSVISTLTNIGKARYSTFSFTEAWTRFVDHVYVVSGEVLAGTLPRT
jgi:hypothetical protein